MGPLIELGSLYNYDKMKSNDLILQNVNGRAETELRDVQVGLASSKGPIESRQTVCTSTDIAAWYTLSSFQILDLLYQWISQEDLEHITNIVLVRLCRHGYMIV